MDGLILVDTTSVKEFNAIHEGKSFTSTSSS